MPQIETERKPRAEARGESVLVKKGQERLKIWEKAEGMWEYRKSDPLKELDKIRKEMDRKLP